MKYSEYQVWFHAFNNAISTFGSRPDIEPNQSILLAESAANKVLDRFKEVEAPTIPQAPEGFDLQGLVSQVAKDLAKKGKK